MTLASGLGFTEGPLWTLSGRLIVTGVSRGELYEVPFDGTEARAVAEPGGGPNGIAEDTKGTIWIAQNGAAHVPSRSPRPVGPSIQSWTDDVHDVVTDGLVAPNDCVIGPDGRLWFTDPVGLPEADDPRLGRVCALDTATGETEDVIGTAEYPNGLAFGMDPDDFYLVETRRHRIAHYRQTSEGLAFKGVFAQMTAGAPDGICVDSLGHVFVATTEGQVIEVYNAGGVLVETIDLGGAAWPTNCCFAGAELNLLAVTAAKGGRVLCIERQVAGRRP